MAGDFPVDDRQTFGEWLYAQIAENVVIEQEGWAPEIAERAGLQLQRDRPEEERLRVVVPWLRAPIAFTAPGRFIYLSRRLLERCPKEEMVAFIVAHEVAHHDLGHVEMFHGWLKRVAHFQAASLAVLTFRALQKRMYGPERECAADQHALRLCLHAGYDSSACLNVFDVLENFALDFGDVDLVFGPDQESDEELAPDAAWLTKLRIWLWQRTRGYLPIRDRKAALVHALEALEGGEPPEPALS